MSVLALGACSFLGGAVAVRFGPDAMPRVFADATPPPPSFGTSDLDALATRFEAVARKAGPSTVSIEAIKTSTGRDGKSKTTEDSGSGILAPADDGKGVLVFTNNHVIATAKPEQITVNLADGRLLRPTQVLADPESDIAVLRLDATGLPTATLGDSDRARIGQWVLALGSPFGLNQSLTHGIISARERGSVSLGATIRIKDFLQTDAAINPGSSGGPLLNLDGEVIGINTAIASQSGSNSGIAFAIPINLVKRISKQLQERGAVSRGYLGVLLAQTFEPADAIKLGLDRSRGARVDQVYPGTPAEAAGLKVNDVVLAVGDVSVKSDTHLINLISALPAGQKVRLQVWRERQAMSLDATVGDWAAGQARFRASSGQ
ncbi:MAG: trypsin-like peptidase domain-containing protein [Gemmataceae bacterium]